MKRNPDLNLSDIRLKRARDENSGPSNSRPANSRGHDNQGYVRDAVTSHNQRPLPAVPGSDDDDRPVYDNPPDIYAEVKVRVKKGQGQGQSQPRENEVIYDNEVPVRDIGHDTSSEKPEAGTGNNMATARFPVDIREFEAEADSDNNQEPEAIYGNATVADLAATLNEVVQHPRQNPRKLTMTRRKTGEESSDSDTSWWTDDEESV